MQIKIAVVFLSCLGFAACATHPGAPANSSGDGSRVSAAAPLAIGESFTIDSAIMGEARRINVFVPTVYGEKLDTPLPVLYMPDGGLDEDFLHIAGLVQVLVSNGGMRPFMLVGIPNTNRRRDLTGPTSNPEDRKIAPMVGGSAAFRRFIKEELMPAVRSRYRTTDEAGIIGESLAGLFVVETFFVEPDLFQTYIVIDPSLWWATEELVRSADARLTAAPPVGKSLFLTNSNEPGISGPTARLAAVVGSHAAKGFTFYYSPLPAEGHATIYHPAALLALRTVLPPPPVTK